MLTVYQALAQLASSEFDDIVASAAFVGGTVSSPNKLRLTLRDDSFIDIWLSVDGDYAYHWERRRQQGKFYRWDNAPHHPHVATFPNHFHQQDDMTILESHLSANPETALRDVLEFVRTHWA